jgi:hypothetical protein
MLRCFFSFQDHQGEGVLPGGQPAKGGDNGVGAADVHLAGRQRPRDRTVEVSILWIKFQTTFLYHWIRNHFYKLMFDHLKFYTRVTAKPGANPTIASYNASVVHFYNSMSSLARFKKNSFFYFEKRSSLLQRWRCSCKFKSRRIGSWSKTLTSGSAHRKCCSIRTWSARSTRGCTSASSTPFRSPTWTWGRCSFRISSCRVSADSAHLKNVVWRTTGC